MYFVSKAEMNWRMMHTHRANDGGYLDASCLRCACMRAVSMNVFRLGWVLHDTSYWCSRATHFTYYLLMVDCEWTLTHTHFAAHFASMVKNAWKTNFLYLNFVYCLFVYYSRSIYICFHLHFVQTLFDIPCSHKIGNYN